MNPLTFFSITVGGVFAARSGLRWLLNDESPQTIADKSSVPSFVIPVLMGLYLHRAMLRKTDARLSLTIGAIFFALGSWGAVVSVLLIGARIGISPAELTPDRVLAGDGAGRSLLSMSVISAIARSAAVGVFVAGAHQRKVVTAIAWCLSFYLLLVVIGLGLVAAGSALKAL